MDEHSPRDELPLLATSFSSSRTFSYYFTKKCQPKQVGHKNMDERLTPVQKDEKEADQAGKARYERELSCVARC